MDNLDLQSENRKDFHFDDLTGGSAAAWPAGKEIETVAPADSERPDQRRERRPQGQHSIRL